MGKKQYQIESDFDDLHGDPDEDLSDLDVDLSDSDNPIIKAALAGDEDNWQPPEDDKGQDDDEDSDLLDEDDGLDELDEDEDGEDSPDDDEEDEDDQDADDDDEDEDDDEDDDRSYSKKVQARIDRERDKRRRDVAAAEARVAALERKFELQEQERKFESEKAKVDQKLADLKAKKIEAKEEGDTAAEVEIDDQILDLRAKLRTQEAEIEKARKEVDTTPQPVGDDTPPAGLKWLKKYPQFHTNQQFQKVVLRADGMVADRGFDRNEDDYYAEIEKIVAVQFPEIVKKANKTTRKKQVRDTARRKKRSAVGGTQRAGTQRKATKSRTGRIRLTKADQRNMQMFGMDPKDPEHIKNWAEAKGS